MDFLRHLDGTLPQWGTLLAVLGGLLAWWIKGMPERARVKNEATVIEDTEAARIRAEYTALNKLAREDIHKLRNELAQVNAEQRKCGQALAEAHAETRSYKDDMSTLLFLIRLLVSEVKRLDPSPDNIIIQQAEMMLEELERKRAAATPSQSAVEVKAVLTVEAAEETLAEVREAAK